MVWHGIPSLAENTGRKEEKFIAMRWYTVPPSHVSARFIRNIKLHAFILCLWETTFDISIFDTRY